MKFQKPTNWRDLTKPEKRALRRSWRQSDEVQAHKAAKKAKRQAALSRWLLSPVLPLIKGALVAAVEDDLRGVEAMDDALEYLMDKADDLADFGFLDRLPIPGIGMTVELLTDSLLGAARAQLRVEILEVWEALKAEGLDV